MNIWPDAVRITNYIHFSVSSSMTLPPAMPMAKCPIDNQYLIGNRLRGIVTKGCPYVVMWHAADGRYPSGFFL